MSNKFTFLILILITSCNNELNEETTFYEDGNLMSIVRVIEGIKNDTSFYFYPNGNLQRFEIYSNGLKQGQYVSYHLNGNIKQVAEFKNGNLNGIVKTFNNSGKLISEYSTLKKSAIDTLEIEIVDKEIVSEREMYFTLRSNIPTGNFLLAIPNGTLKKTESIGRFNYKCNDPIDEVILNVRVIIDDSLFFFYKNINIELPSNDNFYISPKIF